MPELNLPRESTLKRIADAVERISMGTPLPQDNLVTLLFDGTKERYKEVMRLWFLSNGAEGADSKTLTALVDKWYSITRIEWDGYTEFYQPSISAVSTGTKGGDNAGMSCTPSSDTKENNDDYAGHPFFAVVDCNWEVDATTKDVVITAIDGITSNFDRYNTKKYVGVLQMNGYIYTVDGGNTYRFGWTSTMKPYANIDAPFGIKVSDNSFRSWTIHAKYMAHVTDGKLTCCAGVIPTARKVSHNTLHTYAAANGAQYSGGSITDDSFLKIMAFIKYGSMTLDGILQGCINHNATNNALVSETGVNRILIAANNTAYPIGSTIIIGVWGSSSTSHDRNAATFYSVSGEDGRKVVDVQSVTLNGSAYTAIYVDGDSFDTVANGASVAGTTYISTWHWETGYTDSVLGNDGSPVSYTNGKYPAKLQGIEYMVGGYEVYADVILNLTQEGGEYYYEPYVVRSSGKQSTAITGDYEATGIKLLQPAESSWQYTKKLAYSKGCFFCCEYEGGSSTTYTRDGAYLNAAAVGTREWLAFGRLTAGAAHGGLSAFGGDSGLSNAHWGFLARLSPNGNRGELSA